MSAFVKLKVAGHCMWALLHLLLEWTLPRKDALQQATLLITW